MGTCCSSEKVVPYVEDPREDTLSITEMVITTEETADNIESVTKRIHFY